MEVEVPDPGIQAMLAAAEAAEHTEGEAGEVESTEEVIPLLDQFDSKLSEVPFSQLEAYILDFEAKLRDLVKELGPGRIPKGYVGRQVMVSVMGHFGRLIADMLPKEARLDSGDGIDFAIELASILYPNTWGRPTYDLTMYDPMLTRDGAQSNGPIVREHAASELTLKARRRMAQIERQAAEQKPTESDIILPESVEEYTHLVQIESGIYPAPFNGENLHRWLYVDTSFALDPNLDLRNAFRLSPQHVAYLRHAATISLASYKQSPEMASTERGQAHIACLNDFMEKNQLRQPWHTQ